MALDYMTLPGDVDHLVANDHAVVNRLFEHVEAGRGDRRTLADQICFQVALHADAEERTFYPALKKIGQDEAAEKLIGDHQGIKELAVAVQQGDPGDPAFEQALAGIIADLREHAAEEETTFLPELREAVGAEEMGRLGEQFIAAKRTAPTFAHPHAPASGLGHKLADAATGLVDKVRDKASGRMDVLGTDASGLLDPQAQRILDVYAAMDQLPLEILKPSLARKEKSPFDAVTKIAKEQGKTVPEPVGEVREIKVPGADGDITLRVYTPEGAGDEPLPVVFWIHGGGFVLFGLDDYDPSCRGLCVKTGAIVVSPAYRLAPEHVFPASHDDVLASYRWVAEHAGELGGDPSRIAIGGESVGGTMAAATSLALLAAGEELPVAQVLCYPLVTAELYGESMDDSADARPLGRPLLSWMAMHAFEGVPEAATDPRVALLNIPSDGLAGLPPTLVLTDERDVLRSQGEDFARNLQDAGVWVKAVRYEGIMHDFFGAAAVLDKAETAQQEAAAHLTAAFTAAREALRG